MGTFQVIFVYVFCLAGRRAGFIDHRFMTSLADPGSNLGDRSYLCDHGSNSSVSEFRLSTFRIKISRQLVILYLVWLFVAWLHAGPIFFSFLFSPFHKLLCTLKKANVTRENKKEIQLNFLSIFYQDSYNAADCMSDTL